jgi:hypothetical protein
MAGGLRVTGNLKDGMVILNVQHDTEYDLMQIGERFEVPYADMDSMHEWQKVIYVAMIHQRAKEAAKLAVERYERLRHWRFKSSMPVEIDYSEAQYDLNVFRSSLATDFTAVDEGSNIDSLGTVAYVVKLWFVVPKIRVEVIKDEITDPGSNDGFVNEHKMTNYAKLGDN